ncbi:MAG: hypothetical protein H0W73_13735 [Bacteroidetes bacterium]|nr:hypothetical protein [Bacteroidota bacterium]
MDYFGLEIFDGKPLKEISLEENLPLEEQWFHLTEDITCIDYIIHDVLDFSVDVGWYPNIKITPDAGFRTRIIEGPYTDGMVFYEKTSKTIAQMKLDLQEGILLIQSFKKLSIEDIFKTKIRDFL